MCGMPVVAGNARRMATDFQPKLSILPPPQRTLWPEIGTIPAGFVLYGGTALALHLGHRTSVDFDFFADHHFDPAPLTAIVERDGPVKVSFFGVPQIQRLQPPLVAPGNALRIASLLDLAGTKAAVVQQRAEAKDYLDHLPYLGNWRRNP